MASSSRTATALALALAVAGSNVALAQGTFPGRAWPAELGIEATSLSTADFDRDGRPDLAVCSMLYQRFGVLRSEGRGLFQPFAGHTSTFQPVSSCAADFDGDGIPDLVMGGQQLVLALGQPAGTVGAPATIATGIWAYSIEAHDFDLDGKLDLALADLANLRVVVLRNLGGGSFGTPTSYPLPSSGSAYDVAIGDITGDGIPDLFVGYAVQNGGGIAWMPGLGGFGFGAWQDLVMSAAVKDLDLGDLDGDGDLDLAAAAGDREAVLLNTGGVLGAPLTLGLVFTEDVDAADFDGDGREDLAFVTLSGTVRLYLALAGGGFSTPTTALAGNSAEDLRALDVDGDGAMDVVVGCTSGAVVLLGDGTGALASLQAIDASSTAGLAVGDMDGDGIDDLVTSAIFGSALSVRRGDGNGGFGPAASFPTPAGVTRIALGRIDSDADFDVAAVHSTNKLSILLNDGAGGLSAALTVPSTTAPSSLAIADFNGDGYRDVALTAGGDAHTQGALVGIHFGNGSGGMSAPAITVTGLTPNSISAADLDGDGDIDLACANYVTGSFFLLWNDGSGQMSAQSKSIGGTSSALCTGDLDADGHVDVVLSTSSLVVLRGLGAGAFAPPVSYPLAGGDVMRMRDFDGDGLLDLAVASGPRIQLYSGDGNGGLTSLRAFAARGGPVYAMASVDVDRDGRLDLLSSIQGLILHRNLGEAIAPVTYCVAKTNSLGCVPAIGWIGASSASASSGFELRAAQVRNKKVGLLMYGVAGRAAVPFSGGVLCVRAPIKRTPVVNSGGSPSGNDCSGVYALDMNAFASGALGGTPLPELRQPGTAVTAQFWGRDPGFPPPGSTTLSDAIEYVVGS